MVYDSEKPAIHPLTHIIIAIEFSALVLLSPFALALLLIILFYIIVMLLPLRSDSHLTRAFGKLLSVAALFLFLIHGISLHPVSISNKVIDVVLPSFIRIATPVTAVLYLSRNITSEEFFALCIDLKLPPSVILILFRTIWLVPRLMERMDEVVVAQKLRGIQIKTPYQRLKAIIPTLSTIFSSMVEETSENALVLTTRGFLLPEKKSHVSSLSFRIYDVLIISAATILVVFLCF